MVGWETPCDRARPVPLSTSRGAPRGGSARCAFHLVEVCVTIECTEDGRLALDVAVASKRHALLIRRSRSGARTDRSGSKGALVNDPSGHGGDGP